MKPKCHYCGGEVVFGPGMIMVEVLGDTESLVAHEECYQQSGDDEGYRAITSNIRRGGF